MYWWERKIKPDLTQRSIRGPGHRAREAMIRMLTECQEDHSYWYDAEPDTGPDTIQLTPAVESFLDQIKSCSLYFRRGKTYRRRYCGHSLCPHCNREKKADPVQCQEASLLWRMIQPHQRHHGKFRYLSINIAILDQRNPQVAPTANRARGILQRILSEYSGVILLGEFELSLVEPDRIKLGLHAWLVSSAVEAWQIERDLREDFGHSREVQLKPMEPGEVQREFENGVSYAAKLPKPIYGFLKGRLPTPVRLVRLIDAFEALRSGEGRKGLRVVLGLKSRRYQFTTIIHDKVQTYSGDTQETLPVALVDPSRNTASSTS
jgi:hypothetical protein